jgi:hypothetical protein
MEILNKLLFRAALIILLLGKVGFAYSEEEATPIPTAPALPAPSDGENAGTIINSSNVQDFREIIIPEFYPLVRARLINMDAVSNLRFDLGNFKTKNLPDAAPEPDILQPNGLIKENYHLKEGLPFPDWAAEKDGGKKALKLIWNLQAVYWNYKVFSTDFSITYIQDSKSNKQLKGIWQRMYPALLSSEDKSVQLFREVIEFTSPSILKTLKYLTFRFRGLDEDMIWLFSPALKKARELTGSNRADSILDSSFSPDDLLGWSGKAELSDFVYDKEITALVPFSSFDTKTTSSATEGCDNYIKAAPAAPTSRWNYASHRFPDAFPWLPTDVVFAPRKLVRLELIPKDPFSLYGRQILYVDRELMIPYYKFVFNRAGYLWKTIFNVPVFLQSKDKSRNYIFTDFVLVEDRQSKSANSVEFDNAYFCKAFNEKIKISNFDPQKLMAAGVPTATPVPAKKK